MGSFGGTRWRPYLDEEAQEIRDEKLDHLKRKYDGPTDFVKQKLKEEEVLSLEQKIDKVQSEIENKQKDLDKFKQIKRQREQQDKLRDKKELLKQKQKQLKQVQRRGGLTEKDALANAAHQVWNKCSSKASKPRNSDLTVVDLFTKDRYQRRVYHVKDKQLEGTEKIDELVEDVERLQNQVAELNGGPEDCFMELESMEVSV